MGSLLEWPHSMAEVAASLLQYHGTEDIWILLSRLLQ